MHVVQAEALVKIPKKLIVIGVLVNFALLFASAIYADRELSVWHTVLFLLASALPYVIALCWLQIVAAYKIGSGD